MLYVHHVPGRMRVRVRHLKGNREAGRRLCARLRLLGGVRQAAANPATGSIIVHYDHRLVAIADLWRVLHEAGAVDAPAPPIVQDPIARDPIARDHEYSIVPQTAQSAAETLFKQLIAVMVEKAMQHSARALLAALV